VSDGSGFRRRIVKDLGTELVAKPPHTTLKSKFFSNASTNDAANIPLIFGPSPAIHIRSSP
jgi:hypothetical protein